MDFLRNDRGARSFSHLMWVCKWKGREQACKPASKYVLYAPLLIHHAFPSSHCPCLTRAYYHRNIIEHCFVCCHQMQDVTCHWSHNRWGLHITFGLFVEPEWALVISLNYKIGEIKCISTCIHITLYLCFSFTVLPYAPYHTIINNWKITLLLNCKSTPTVLVHLGCYDKIP